MASIDTKSVADNGSSSDIGSNKCRLFVSGLDLSTTEGDLINIFKVFGKLNAVDYGWHKSGPLRGKPRGYAFLDFNDEEAAMKAMKAGNNPNKLHARGKRIIVNYSKSDNIRPSDSRVFTEASAAFIDKNPAQKRGRDEAVGDDDGQSDTQKLKNIRSIEDKMRALEETLKKLDKN